MTRGSRTMLHFLVFSGLPLSDSASDDLLLACCAMARSGQKKFDIKTDEMQGRIETEFAETGMQSIWGYQFAATLETNWGNTKMRWIVRINDLENIRDLDLDRVLEARRAQHDWDWQRLGAPAQASAVH